MVFGDKHQLERALEAEQNTAERQVLLKQLWKLDQRRMNSAPATETPSECTVRKSNDAVRQRSRLA